MQHVCIKLHRPQTRTINTPLNAPRRCGPSPGDYNKYIRDTSARLTAPDAIHHPATTPSRRGTGRRSPQETNNYLFYRAVVVVASRYYIDSSDGASIEKCRDRVIIYTSLRLSKYIARRGDRPPGPAALSRNSICVTRPTMVSIRRRRRYDL